MKTEQANTSETSDPWSLEDPVNRRLVQRGMRLPRGRRSPVPSLPPVKVEPSEITASEQLVNDRRDFK